MDILQTIASPLAFTYFLCAVIGGTVLLLQLFFSLIGFGGDHFETDGIGPDDGMGHTETVGVFKMLSLRTAVAGLAFFGIGGLAGLAGGGSKPLSLFFAVLAGFSALFIVYYLYSLLSRLQSDGTVSEKSLVGAQGTVYLRIPAANTGIGKVQVVQQDRTMEYDAITLGGELKNGTPITVVNIVSPGVVEVK